MASRRALWILVTHEKDTPGEPPREAVLALLANYRAPRPGAMLGLLLADGALYAASWAALLYSSHPLLRAVLAIVNAVAIARLFSLGHDACHGSAFRRRWANRLVGRIAFLPSLTPFRAWEHVHNTLHHGFLNLRGKDGIYAPLTKPEYDALPGWRRALERCYRHPLGPGLYYAVEVWQKELWFRAPGFGGPLAAAAFLAVQIAIAASAARRSGQNPATVVALTVFLPQAIWLQIIGFLAIQPHTHPQVVWYDDRKRWDPFVSQLENSVHVRFPRIVNALFGHFLEPAAHRIDGKIPRFRLAEAQAALGELLPGRVLVQAWSWRRYVQCRRRCQLYDYANQRWLTFRGE